MQDVPALVTDTAFLECQPYDERIVGVPGVTGGAI